MVVMLMCHSYHGIYHGLPGLLVNQDYREGCLTVPARAKAALGKG